MRTLNKDYFFDVIIVGAGVSGPTIAEQLTKKSLKVLMRLVSHILAIPILRKKQTRTLNYIGQVAQNLTQALQLDFFVQKLLEVVQSSIKLYWIDLTILHQTLGEKQVVSPFLTLAISLLSMKRLRMDSTFNKFPQSGKTEMPRFSKKALKIITINVHHQ